MLDHAWNLCFWLTACILFRVLFCKFRAAYFHYLFYHSSNNQQWQFTFAYDCYLGPAFNPERSNFILSVQCHFTRENKSVTFLWFCPLFLVEFYSISLIRYKGFSRKSYKMAFLKWQIICTCYKHIRCRKQSQKNLFLLALRKCRSGNTPARRQNRFCSYIPLIPVLHPPTATLSSCLSLCHFVANLRSRLFFFHRLLTDKTYINVQRIMKQIQVPCFCHIFHIVFIM